MSRKTAAWCSALLIVAQMVTGPAAHPVSATLATDDRDRAATFDTAHPGDDCADRMAGPDRAPAGSPDDHPVEHSDCTCVCPCGHTPALAMPSVAPMRPALPEALSSEPRGPAYPPPLFDFLRPPD